MIFSILYDCNFIFVLDSSASFKIQLILSA